MTKSIIDCINNDLIDIYEQSAKIEGLAKTVSQCLPEQIRPHIQVASFNKGTLTLATSRQDIASQLRYQLPELRDNLRKVIFQLAQVKLIVR